MINSYLISMSNQTIQNHEKILKQKEFLIECSKCHRVCACDSVQEVMFDEDTETAIIRINEEYAYCSKCLQSQIQEEMQQTRSLQQRFIYYKEFQSSFEERQIMKHSSELKNDLLSQAQGKEIIQLEKEEVVLTLELNQLKEESTQLKEKFYALEVQEEKFWEGINKIERRTSKVEQKSLNTKFDKQISKNTLEELAKMSVLHMFLDIKVDDNLAYVQGMAMGKKGENIDISWQQVSIGLGHLLIGLNFLVIKYSYEYKKIEEILIKGCQSEVIIKGRKKTYSTINNKENEKLFGQLLEILLLQTFFLCQHILEAENIEYSQQFKIPFLISVNDLKIVDLYIDPLKLQERMRWNIWTKAMRYFLIDFKHIITVYAINDKYL